MSLDVSEDLVHPNVLHVSADANHVEALSLVITLPHVFFPALPEVEVQRTTLALDIHQIVVKLPSV